MLRSLIFLLLLTCANLSAHAQGFIDVLEFEYRNSPSAKDSSTVSIDDLYLNFTYPKVVDSTYTKIIGLELRQQYIRVQPMNSITLKFGASQEYGKNRILMMALPKISSDLSRGVRMPDIQLGGVFIVTHKHTEDFSSKFGFYANTDLFGPLVVPILGVNWQINPKSTLTCALPISAEYRIQQSENFSFGITYSGKRYSYYLSRDEDYQEVSDNGVWAYADYRLDGKWFLNIKAGHSVLRSFSIQDSKETIPLSYGPGAIGDDRPDGDRGIQDGVSLGLGLSWRFEIN